MSNEDLKRIKARQQQKHDKPENWKKAGDNGFIPLSGEIIIYDSEDSTQSGSKIKIGDGKTNVNDLEFVTGGGGTSIFFRYWEEGDG